MADRFENHEPGLTGVGDPGAPITTGSDTADLAGGTCRAFYVSADCTLKMTNRLGVANTYTLVGGQHYPWRIARVWATGSSFGTAQFVPIY